MKHAPAILIAVALFGSPALAQPNTMPHAEDHLEPDAAILGHSAFMGGYELVLREVLHAAYERDTMLRMIAQPSFSVPEYAVGLRGGKVVGKGDFETFLRGPPYRIFGLKPAVSIWTYQSIEASRRGVASAPTEKSRALTREALKRLQASVPASPHDVKVAQCEAGISDGLGDRIVEVWRKMLMRTRYSPLYAGGTDGTSYHFSMFVRGAGDMSGHIWLPDRNSSTGALVALADEMYRICNSKDARMDQLEKLTAELEHRLN